MGGVTSRDLRAGSESGAENLTMIGKRREVSVGDGSCRVTRWVPVSGRHLRWRGSRCGLSGNRPREGRAGGRCKVR